MEACGDRESLRIRKVALVPGTCKPDGGDPHPSRLPRSEGRDTASHAHSTGACTRCSRLQRTLQLLLLTKDSSPDNEIGDMLEGRARKNMDAGVVHRVACACSAAGSS